jgi:hypothetical protein
MIETERLRLRILAELNPTIVYLLEAETWKM